MHGTYVQLLILSAGSKIKGSITHVWKWLLSSWQMLQIRREAWGNDHIL